MLRYMLEKFYEIKSRTALASIIKHISKEFGIPKKSVNLIKMMLQDSNGNMKILSQLTEASGIERGMRQ
jgi:hypothetical protein